MFRYEFWDTGHRRRRASKTYATLDAILKGGCIPLRDTATLVDRCGIYSELVEVR